MLKHAFPSSTAFSIPLPEFTQCEKCVSLFSTGFSNIFPLEIQYYGNRESMKSLHTNTNTDSEQLICSCEAFSRKIHLIVTDSYDNMPSFDGLQGKLKKILSCSCSFSFSGCSLPFKGLPHSFRKTYKEFARFRISLMNFFIREIFFHA